jgi:hypothetical protein
MNIQKAIGRIADPKGENSCRIEVLSFKKNDVNITDRVEIRATFPPQGFVFAPNFFDNFDLDINSIIEFTTSSFAPTSKGDHHDAVLMDPKKPVKPAGVRVFHLPPSVLFNDHSFNQPQLKTFIKEELSHFYIRVNNFLYGPFKSTNHEVIPKQGMQVNKYNLVKEYNVDGNTYILFEPIDLVAPIDCMTQTQLADFFKKQIRNLEWTPDINQLKKVLEAQPLQDLDQFRMQRLVANLDAFSLTLDEINSLLSLSPEFKTFYQSALAKANDEIKKEMVTPFLEEKNKLQQSVNSLTTNINKLKKEEDTSAAKLEKLQKDVAFMSSEKERLINDIRTHAIINSNNTSSSKLFTYEEQVFSNQTEDYANLDEYINLVNNSIQTNENGKSRYAHKIINQFKAYKCFLCNEVQIIIQLARLSNNCRVLIQQVEPDWLKFESLYKNGLEYIWKVAHNNPQILHFFILEDLNLASIECYGRPLLDMVNGIRHKLPATDLPWPCNLWVFGLPLQNKGEDFGLSLMKKTFDNWGGFPTDKISIDTPVNSGKYLLPSQLIDHSIIPTVDINPYFA